MRENAGAENDAGSKWMLLRALQSLRAITEREIGLVYENERLKNFNGPLRTQLHRQDAAKQGRKRMRTEVEEDDQDSTQQSIFRGASFI
jgi:hypothetical protein